MVGSLEWSVGLSYNSHKGRGGKLLFFFTILMTVNDYIPDGVEEEVGRHSPPLALDHVTTLKLGYQQQQQGTVQQNVQYKYRKTKYM